MKIRKVTTWLVILFLVFIIAFLGLGMVRSQQTQEQETLDQQLSGAKLRLDKLQIEPLYTLKAGLETRLIKTQNELETARDFLRITINDVEITSLIYRIAGQSQVEVTEIRSSQIQTNPVKGVPASALPVFVTARGSIPDLYGFTSNLSEAFPTSTMESAEVSASKDLKDPRATGQLRMLVHAYQD